MSSNIQYSRSVNAEGCNAVFHLAAFLKAVSVSYSIQHVSTIQHLIMLKLLRADTLLFWLQPTLPCMSEKTALTC